MKDRTTGEHVPSPRQIPFPRLPSLPHVSPTQAITITPASARSVSSVVASPYLSAQCSPSISFINQQYFSLATPGPLELPESLISSSCPTIGHTHQGTKPERLMRKLSTKAKDTLRRKTSSSNQSRRDESSGPVARRRSDSKTLTVSVYSAEPESLSAEVPPVGLGMHYATSLIDEFNHFSDVASISDRRPEVVAPAVPEDLVAGCLLTKSTRSRKQDKIFYLDAEGSRVSWAGTVVTKSIHIDNIKSIRKGEEAASQWHAVRGEHLEVAHCFIINYASSEQSNSVKTLHLIAHSERDLQLWVETLEALAKHREDLMTGLMGSSERLSVLRAHWDTEMAKKSFRQAPATVEGLDLTAITALCRKLHIHCPRSDIVRSFDLADQRQSGLLTYEHFRNFVKRLRERVDIRPIFDDLKDPSCETIARAVFLQFLQSVQGIDLNIPSVKAIWEGKTDRLVANSACPCGQEPKNCHIDFPVFASFLSSADCRVNSTAEKPRTVLDKPINEYFISSSHNTYLLGRQVNGTSSVEAYVTALRRGCRSVEIDCWDGDNDNPRVTHGFTKTTSVLFVDVVHAINRCAFDASPYPVILSLEVHCNSIQQARMVEIMREVFGERLVLAPLANHTNILPSPEELKYRILVKVKATEAYPNFSAISETLSSRKRSTSSPYRRPAPVHSNSSLGQTVPILPLQAMMSPPDSVYSPTERSMTTTSASSEDDSDVNATSPPPSEISTRRVKTSKIIPVLAALGSYFQGYSFRGPHDLTFHQFNHIFSLNESTAHALCNTSENKALFEDHNLKHMCRVYPKNTRINSSNFDPNTFWRRGVQMVALNYQTYDTHMQMNQAMFASGPDRTGYVLKPDYLRKQRMASGSFEHRLKLPRYRISFAVKIISAQQLPRLAAMSKSDSIDPFVEVQMLSAEDKARGIATGYGGEASASTNQYHGIGMPYIRRTKVVRDNGYNPQFNNTIDLTIETKYPELVFVRFVVYQAGKNSRQLAVFTSKLDSLQRGYRHVPLYNGHGEELIFSTLFCQVTKRQPMLIPSSLQDLADRTPRQRSLRTILSRNLSTERGRERPILLEEAQLLRQRRVNEEIQEMGMHRK